MRLRRDIPKQRLTKPTNAEKKKKHPNSSLNTLAAQTIRRIADRGQETV